MVQNTSLWGGLVRELEVSRRGDTYRTDIHHGTNELLLPNISRREGNKGKIFLRNDSLIF